MKLTAIKFEPELLAALDSEANRRHVSRSWLIRELCRQGLKQAPVPVGAPTGWAVKDKDGVWSPAASASEVAPFDPSRLNPLPDQVGRKPRPEDFKSGIEYTVAMNAWNRQS